MSKKFSSSMFDQLKSAMSEQRSGGSFKDILKTEVGNSYLVRLIPNVDDITSTIYHYYNHGWRSLATGQYVSCQCPTTQGNRCPICEERVRLYRGDEDDKKNAKLLGRKEQWITNVIVVDDPVNPENNGTIKILRYGKQLDKIIHDATEGIDKDEFGARIFDLSEDGCNLRIMVEKNDGGYPTYVSSKFLRESAISGMTEKKIEDTYENLFDLSKVFETKSLEEVQDILDTHFFCEVTNKSEPSESGLEVNTVNETVEPIKIENEESTDYEDETLDTDEEVQNKLKDLMADL
jgi:hypothetical protein